MIHKCDRELLDKIMKDKNRYRIKVDNDAVYVEDKTTDNNDEPEWESFYEYGWEFIIELFEYLGFESDGV